MNLLEKQLNEGRLWAQLKPYKRLLDISTEAINEMQEIAPDSYLSLSWGKQSIVLAHMLFKIQPDVPMLFLASGETWLMHNFEEVIEKFISLYPINFSIMQTDNVYDGKSLDWQQSRDKGKGDLEALGSSHDWDGWYWGLSKDESKQRQITLSRRDTQPGDLHKYIFKYKSGKYRCCPLSDWTIRDLAAYIVTYDIPLLSIYHKLGLEARTTARLTRKAAEWGGLTALQYTDISTFNRLCERFPDLRGVQRQQ